MCGPGLKRPARRFSDDLAPPGCYAAVLPRKGEDGLIFPLRARSAQRGGGECSKAYFTRFQTWVLHIGATMQPFSFSCLSDTISMVPE